MAFVDVDTSTWPIVYIRLPPNLSDGAGDRYVGAMQDLLDKGEPFAIVFEGQPEAVKSSEFNGVYMRWYKASFEQQKANCRGLVRIETDAERRVALEKQAREYADKGVTPYPFEVSETAKGAHMRALELLSNG